MTNAEGFRRYHVKCVKCNWEWMARTPEPERCALCNNPHINKPKVRHHSYERAIANGYKS